MVLRLVGWNPTWLIFATPSLSKELSKSGTTWHFVSNQMAAGIPNPRTLSCPGRAPRGALLGEAMHVESKKSGCAGRAGRSIRGASPAEVLKVVCLKNDLLKKTTMNLSETKPAEVLREK